MLGDLVKRWLAAPEGEDGQESSESDMTAQSATPMAPAYGMPEAQLPQAVARDEQRVFPGDGVTREAGMGWPPGQVGSRRQTESAKPEKQPLFSFLRRRPFGAMGRSSVRASSNLRKSDGGSVQKFAAARGARQGVGPRNDGRGQAPGWPMAPQSGFTGPGVAQRQTVRHPGDQFGAGGMRGPLPSSYKAYDASPRHFASGANRQLPARGATGPFRSPFGTGIPYESAPVQRGVHPTYRAASVRGRQPAWPGAGAQTGRGAPLTPPARAVRRGMPPQRGPFGPPWQ